MTGDLKPILQRIHDWKFCENHFCSNSYSNDPTRWQFCTCHNSWAIMGLTILWLDQIIFCYVRAVHIFIRFGLKAHKSFVKYDPVIKAHQNKFVMSWPGEFMIWTGILLSVGQCVKKSKSCYHCGIFIQPIRVSDISAHSNQPFTC